MNISAHERLKEMPEWFYGNMVSKFLGIEESMARNYLSRWHKAGLLSTLGPRSRIYVNKTKLNNNDIEILELKAMKHLYPEGIVSGDKVLHANGVITQIPGKTELTVLKARSFPSYDKFGLNPKSSAWFRKAFKEDLITDSDYSSTGYGFKEMCSEAVLAEQLSNNTIMDLDDLYLEDLNPEVFLKACKVFKVDNKDMIEDMVNEMETSPEMSF